MPDRDPTLGMPRNVHFFRGITETAPSLFHGIFWNAFSVANPYGQLIVSAHSKSPMLILGPSNKIFIW